MTRFGPTIKWQKWCPHRRKKPKIDLWEITGCAQIQEIERPGGDSFVIQGQSCRESRTLILRTNQSIQLGTPDSWRWKSWNWETEAKNTNPTQQIIFA
jgi:hypothetical protein